MSAQRSRRQRSGAAAAVALAAGLLAGLCGGPAVAAPDHPGGSWASHYILAMRAAAIAPQLNSAVTGVGYSAVELEKNIGRGPGDCVALGAGFHHGDLAGPISPRADELSTLQNPTDARRRLPYGRPASGERSQLRDVVTDELIADLPAEGTGPRWQARCADQRTGAATGHTLEVAGAQAAGSTTRAWVDADSREYLGSARAFITGLQTPGGTVDLISSVMQVRHRPGAQPTVSYRIGGSGGTLPSGVDVPYELLTEQFNATAADNAAALHALASLAWR